MRKTTWCLVFVFALGLVAAMGQVNKKGQGVVGVWNLEVGKDADAPKSGTLTIYKDRPELMSWTYKEIDQKGKATNLSWSGPRDGSMHLVKGSDPATMQSFKLDPDGALRRHGEFKDGSSFDARSTLSEDGNTITDEITNKEKDGKVTKDTMVFHRAKKA